MAFLHFEFVPVKKAVVFSELQGEYAPKKKYNKKVTETTLYVSCSCGSTFSWTPQYSWWFLNNVIMLYSCVMNVLATKHSVLGMLYPHKLLIRLLYLQKTFTNKMGLHPQMSDWHLGFTWQNSLFCRLYGFTRCVLVGFKSSLCSIQHPQ